MGKSEKKDAFLIEKRHRDVIQRRKPEQKAELLDAIFSYQTTGEYKATSERVEDKMIELINYRDVQNKKYDETCEKNKQIALEREAKKREKTRNSTNVHERTRTATNSTDKDIDNNNIHTDNITILKDSKATPVVYGDSNINECIEIIKGFNGWIINGAEKKQRIYAKNLIAKLQKLELVTVKGYTRQEVLKALVVVKNNPYHSAKLGSPELIYYNLASLLQVCEDEFTGGRVSKKKFTAI